MLASSSSRIVAAQRLLQKTSVRALSSESTYTPTLVNRRENEMGTGGRQSQAGLKVAIFGASGFLGPYVCTELGKIRLTSIIW